MSTAAVREENAQPDLLTIQKNDNPLINYAIESEIAKRTGKPTAKMFIQESMVFPMKEDFAVDPEELSFSSILRNKIHPKSYLHDNRTFNAFFVSHTPHWFKCCNEVRGDMVWKSKDRYFSKFYTVFYCCMVSNSTTACLIRNVVCGKSQGWSFLLEGRCRRETKYESVF